MKIESNKLLAALKALLPLTQKRTTMPVISNFYLSAGVHSPDGTNLVVRATDLDEFSERIVPCEGDLPACCINAQRLVSLVQKAGDFVEIEATSQSRVKFTGSGTANLPTLGAAEFPSTPPAEFNQIAVNPADLAARIDAISWMPHSVTEQRLRGAPEYATIGVMLSPKEMAVVSTTGVAAARNRIAAIGVDCEFSVPSEYVPFICDSLRQKEATLLLSENWIRVFFDGGFWMGKRPEFVCPTEGIVRFMGETRTVIGKVMVEDILPHLETCQSFSSIIFAVVEFRFHLRSVVISFKNSDDGSTYTAETEGKFTPGVWNTNVSQILGVFKHLSAEHPIEIQKGEDKHYLTDGENEIIVADVRV